MQYDIWQYSLFLKLLKPFCKGSSQLHLLHCDLRTDVLKIKDTTGSGFILLIEFGFRSF